MQPAERPPLATRVRRILVRGVVIEMALLAATGLYLALWYRPDLSELFGSGSGSSASQVVQGIHRWTAWITVLTVIVLGAVAIAEAAVRWNDQPRRRIGVLSGPTIVGVVLVALVSGAALAWDQLGLAEVTVGTNITGFLPLFEAGKVKFALIGGSTVPAAVLRNWFVVHVVTVPILMTALLMRLSKEHTIRRTPLPPVIGVAVDPGPPGPPGPPESSPA